MEDNPLKFGERETNVIDSFQGQIDALENKMTQLSDDLEKFLKEQDRAGRLQMPRMSRMQLSQRTAKRSVAALTNSKAE